MVEKFISYVQPIVVEYGALGVFLATLLEGIIAPIPSSIVPLTAGFFLLPVDGVFLEIVKASLFVVALPVAFGFTLGSLAAYGIGHYGGKPAIERSKKWLGFDWNDLEKIEKRLTRGSGDEIVLFILRLIPVIPGVAISVFCGIIRYPLKTFIVITFFGSMMRAFVLGVAGWYVGEAYVTYSDTIAGAEKYLLIALAVAFISFIGYLYVMKKRRERNFQT